MMASLPTGIEERCSFITVGEVQSSLNSYWTYLPLWKKERWRQEGGEEEWKEGRERGRKENKSNEMKTGKKTFYVSQVGEPTPFFSLCVGRSCVLLRLQLPLLPWLFPNLHYQPVDWEEFEILPCLQANNLAYRSFMYAGRRHKTLGSETGLCYSQHSKVSKLYVHASSLSLFLPTSHVGTVKRPW